MAKLSTLKKRKRLNDISGSLSSLVAGICIVYINQGPIFFILFLLSLILAIYMFAHADIAKQRILKKDYSD